VFPEKIEQAYELLLEGSQLLQNVLESNFFEGYIENGGNVIEGYTTKVVDDVPNEETTTHLNELYRKLQALDLAPEEWRKVAQLVLLKGSVTEPLQANHQLTPDSIGFLFVFLIEQLYAGKKEVTILDNTIGMGNLLLTVLTNLALAGIKGEAYGVDVDDTLLTIAAVNADMTGVDLQLFHQDGVGDLKIEPVDVVIGDLPVGYYPDDKKAARYQMFSKVGHTYAHHLLIEQGMKQVKEGGFGIFLVPTNLFSSEQSKQLKEWMENSAYLQGIIQLPENLFKTENAQKNIVLFQKHGGDAKQAQVLVASLNSLTEPTKIQLFFKQFLNWKENNNF
jgi:site-specific DNA-methyltransferase (adenine-specific)